jgi:hypothetical protein
VRRRCRIKIKARESDDRDTVFDGSVISIDHWLTIVARGLSKFAGHGACEVAVFLQGRIGQAHRLAELRLGASGLRVVMDRDWRAVYSLPSAGGGETKTK